MQQPVAEGRKDDGGKLTYHLLAWDAIAEVVKVLMFGAKKYAPRNWEAGIAYSRVFDAAIRHLTAWWGGEENDPETGLNHLAHALCCIMFLLAYRVRGISALDDRPRPVDRSEEFYIRFSNEKSYTPADFDGVGTLLNVDKKVPVDQEFKLLGCAVMVCGPFNKTPLGIDSPDLRIVVNDLGKELVKIKMLNQGLPEEPRIIMQYDRHHVLKSITQVPQ